MAAIRILSCISLNTRQEERTGDVWKTQLQHKLYREFIPIMKNELSISTLSKAKTESVSINYIFLETEIGDILTVRMGTVNSTSGMQTQSGRLPISS